MGVIQTSYGPIDSNTGQVLGPQTKKQYDLHQESLSNTAYQQANNPTWNPSGTVGLNTGTGDYAYSAGEFAGAKDYRGSGGSPSSGSSGDTSSGDISKEFLKSINSAYDSTISYLNESEGNLRKQLPGLESDVNSLIGESVRGLDTQKQASESQLALQEQRGQQRKESALDAARRLYNELLSGGQQRFGGASSAGEAYRTLGATEYQRNSGQIQQDYSNFVQEVENQRTNIQNQYQTAVQNLEAQRVRMINEVRRDFQNQLLAISRAKSEAGVNKENQRLAALQDLRNQVYQINLAMAQEQNNIDGLLAQANNELQSFVQQGMGAQQSFSANTTTDPVTGLPVGESSVADSLIPTGVRKDDELVGSILRPREGFQFA